MTPNLKDDEKGFILLLSLAFTFWRQQAKFSNISLTLKKKKWIVLFTASLSFSQLGNLTKPQSDTTFLTSPQHHIGGGGGGGGRPQLQDESQWSEVLNNLWY